MGGGGGGIGRGTSKCRPRCNNLPKKANSLDCSYYNLQGPYIDFCLLVTLK